MTAAAPMTASDDAVCIPAQAEEFEQFCAHAGADAPLTHSSVCSCIFSNLHKATAAQTCSDVPIRNSSNNLSSSSTRLLLTPLRAPDYCTLPVDVTRTPQDLSLTSVSFCAAPMLLATAITFTCSHWCQLGTAVPPHLQRPAHACAGTHTCTHRIAFRGLGVTLVNHMCTAAGCSTGTLGT